ncbi:BolA domain UV induced protein Uvi31 [Malassezia cuniculi]|uniref:BolA domain UV induced protein Uvi31 n=1 Tax=Malassezia cuniculi TaxID=948313 RepID=A0AAF0ET77_9BASI|nr:BolA domain UV induced protein Uvi31 [Malassezia cuniculi]
MSIESSMHQKLTASFQPARLAIRNDSSKHAHHAAMVAQGGGNGETHFFVDIVSQAFEGKTYVARHRAINSLLRDEFDRGLHALSIRAKTPAEVEKEEAAAAAAASGCGCGGGHA